MWILWLIVFVVIILFYKSVVKDYGNDKNSNTTTILYGIEETKVFSEK